MVVTTTVLFLDHFPVVSGHLVFWLQAHHLVCQGPSSNEAPETERGTSSKLWQSWDHARDPQTQHSLTTGS